MTKPKATVSILNGLTPGDWKWGGKNWPGNVNASIRHISVALAFDYVGEEQRTANGILISRSKEMAEILTVLMERHNKKDPDCTDSLCERARQILRKEA